MWAKHRKSMNWQLRVKERGTRTIQYPTIELEEMSGICMHLYLHVSKAV
jgi:hypothetical protein